MRTSPGMRASPAMLRRARSIFSKVERSYTRFPSDSPSPGFVEIHVLLITDLGRRILPHRKSSRTRMSRYK